MSETRSDIVARVLGSEIRVYEASAELIANGIAQLAAQAWMDEIGAEQLFELSYQIRATVGEGKTPADCNHVAIELYDDGRCIGSAWARFERGHLAGQPVSEEQLTFPKTFIVESNDYPLDRG